jgi:hypothetical protein
MCVHDRRLKADRHIVPSASPVTKHEDEKQADPATQEVQDTGFGGGADPGMTNIITIAAPKRAGDGADGNLRQIDMRLLRFSRPRYYRESGTMNARKKIETWNAGVKDQLEAMSEVTIRHADFQDLPEFMDTQAAHVEELRKEYRKQRCARQRLNLYRENQRAYANDFNPLSALKEDERQRLVEAYGAGR